MIHKVNIGEGVPMRMNKNTSLRIVGSLYDKFIIDRIQQIKYNQNDKKWSLFKICFCLTILEVMNKNPLLSTLIMSTIICIAVEFFTKKKKKQVNNAIQIVSFLLVI